MITHNQSIAYEKNLKELDITHSSIVNLITPNIFSYITLKIYPDNTSIYMNIFLRHRTFYPS